MWAKFTVDTLIESFEGDQSTYEVLKTTNDVAIVKAGVYEEPAPIWVPGFGVIADLSAQDFQTDTEGAYTSLDRKLYSRENYQIGNEVRTPDGNRYTIHARNSGSQFDQTDIYAYTLKHLGKMGDSDGIR